MPTSKEIKDALDGLGLREIEKNKFTQLNADDGFCRGACMDWMRRVLQGRLAFEYTRTDSDKGTQREARMREIHAIVRGRVVPAAQETEHELERRARDLRGRVDDINRLDGAAWERAAAAYKADETRLNEAMRAQSALGDMGPMAAGWSKLAGELDARRHKPAAGRAFANLQPAAGSAPRRLGTADRVKSTIGKAIRELAPQSAGMFTFTATSEIGHSVSVVRSTTGGALFDPSFGMFAAAGVDLLVRASDYLLDHVYPGMQSLEFIVFVKKP